MASIGGGAAINPGGGRLRELLRLPRRQFDIDTKLTPVEIAERLGAIVEPGRTLRAIFGRTRTNKLFIGEVSMDGFKLVRRIYYRNSGLPVVTGSFEPGPIGTRVRVTMRLSRYVQAFLCVWFGALGLIFLATLFSSSSHKTKNPNSATNVITIYGFLIGMGSLAYVMIAGSFGWEARRARGLLEEALQAAPGAAEAASAIALGL